MRPITTALERIALCKRMRRSLVRFSEPASYVRSLSWVDFIINTFGFIFRYTQGRSSIMTKVDKDNIVLRQTVGIDKLVFLLDGFALENAIKAFLVYEKPRADANRIAHVLPVDKNT